MATLFGDFEDSQNFVNDALRRLRKDTGPNLTQVVKQTTSPFHISDWVGDVLDRVEQLADQQKKDEADRARFKSPSFITPGESSADVVNGILRKRFPFLFGQDKSESNLSLPDPMAILAGQGGPSASEQAQGTLQNNSLPQLEDIKQQQGQSDNASVLNWALSPRGQDFLTAGGYDKFNFDDFAKNPMKFLAQNNNMREFQWGITPDTQKTLLERGVPQDVLSRLHNYLATPEGGSHARPINAAAPGPVESIANSATGSEGLGGLAGGALPFINPVGAAIDMALGSQSGTGASLQDVLGTTTQLGVGKATGPIGEALGKLGGEGLSGALARILARAGVDAGANAGLTAGQMVSAGQNPLEPENLKGVGESAAIGGLAGGALGALGQAPGAFRALPDEVRTPTKIAGTAAVTYGAARASGMDNTDALALAAAMASAPLGAHLAELASRGSLPEWLARPIRSGMGSVTEFTDDEGNPISMSDFLDNLKTNQIRIRYNAKGEAVAKIPGITEKFTVGKRGEPVGELKARAVDALKVGADVANGVPVPHEAVNAGAAYESARSPSGGLMEADLPDNGMAETPSPEPVFLPRATNPPDQRPWSLADEPPEVQANVRANQESRDQIFGTMKGQHESPDKPQADILGTPPDTPPGQGGVTGAPTQDIFTMSESTPNYGMPTETQVKAATQAMDDYLAAGAEYASSKRLTSRALGKLGEAIDPASKYKTPEEKSAFDSVVGAANFEEAITDSVYSRIKPLKALVGDGVRRALLKGGVEVAIPAASVAAYIQTDDTLPDWLREAIIVGGFGIPGVLSEGYKRGLLAEKPWMKVSRKATSTLDPKLAKLIDSDPSRRFFDIMENPNDYNLSPAQLKATQAFRELRDARLQTDNAFRTASGLSPIKYRLNNAIGHYYDMASLGEAGIQVGLPRELTSSNAPGILRRQGLERERVLGGTWRQVWAEHPEVKPRGDVTQILAMELKMSAALRARSVLLKGLKDKGLAETFNVPENAAPAVKQAAAARKAQLINAGWEAIPGLEGSLIHPSAARVVKDVFESSHGAGPFSTIMNVADKATQVVRAAMFSMDLSAFTLQGAQLFMQSPVALLTHIVPLMRATFSEEYFQTRRAGKFASGETGAKYGANIGREFHGIEDQNLPEVIRKIENAGFGRFLPTARQIIFEQNQAVESLLEKLPGGKLPVIGDAVRLAELVPAATYAGFQVANGDEIDPTTMAIMIGIGGAIDLGRSYLGKALADHLDKPSAIKAGVRAAKGTNRIGSVINRAGMGMGAQQSKLERTLLFRSPAMTRNALELTGLALMNPGAEGQFARAYLVKSAMAYTAILATAKLAATGQMDTFDPSDPNSILSVQNLGKLQIPGLDKVSPSSPLIAMVRAALYQDRPDDLRNWQASRMNPLTPEFWHDKGLGVADWLTGRTPDIAGQGVNPAIRGAISSLTGDRIRQPESSPDVNPRAALGGLAQNFLPLSAQAALNTGLAQKSQLGDLLGNALGITPNPAYDSTKKQLVGLGATLGGLNVQPEYPGATLSRLRDQKAIELAQENNWQTLDGKPITNYFDLDSAQRGDVRDALAGNADYEKALKEVKNSGKDSESPTDQYFADRDSVNKDYADALNEAAQQVLDGTQTKEWFKDVVKSQNDTRSNRLDQIDQTYSNISANRPGTKESVLDYLNRNQKPEDKAVDGWYNLFNAATGPDGLDFDKLDSLQKIYMASLSPKVADYVKKQTSSSSKPVNDLVAEYDKAKDDTKEFWTIQDRVFAAAQQKFPFFQQFKSVDDFNNFLQQGSSALGGAIDTDDMATLISRAVPEVAQYLDQVSYWEKKWRLTHPDGEKALVQWYGFSPADKVDYAGRLTGVAQSPESRKSLLLAGGGKNSAAQTLPTILQFMLESGYGNSLQNPAVQLALQGAYNTKKR